MNAEERALRRFSNWSLIITIAVSALSLIGWVFEATILTSVKQYYIPIAPSTALCLLILSVSFLVYNFIPNVILRSITAFSASFTILIALIVLISFFMGIIIEAEHLGFAAGHFQTPYRTGHMSPFSAMLFIVVSSGVLLFCLPTREKQQYNNAASFMALSVSGAGFIMVLGYLYGTPLLYGGTLIPVAFQTALSFLFLGLGIMLASGSSFPPIRLFTGSSSRSLLMRTFFPTVVGVVLLFEAIDKIAISSAANPALTLSLLAIATAVVVGAIITKMAKSIGIGIDQAHSERDAKATALRESEKLYRSLFENMLNGFAYCRMLFENGEPQDFIYLAVNNAFELQTGLKNVVGRKVTEVIPGIRESDRQLFEIYGRVAMTGKPERIEMFVEALHMWFFISVYSPAPEHFVAVFDVITERKRLEKELEERELRFRLLFDSAPLGYQSLDINGNFIDVNQAWLDTLGYTREEVIGSWFGDFLAPGYKEAFRERFPLFKAQGKIHSEFEMVHKKGQCLFIAFDGKIGNDLYGNFKQTHCILKDITEQKRAEELLRESEERYQSLFEQAGDGIFILDTSGNILSVNKIFANMHGFTVEEIRSMGLEGLDVEGAAPAPERIRRIMRGETLSFEVEHYHKDGHTFPMAVTANLVSSGNEKLIIVIHRDLTERKQAEIRLKETLENLRKAVNTTIQVMVSVVEARDPYTAGHQLRVADLARAIATEMGLSRDRIDGLRMAGTIHDLGKISIPAEILSKPTKLTNIEFSLIKGHSQTGYEILKNVESSWPLAQIVYQHHERMDGSGYPRKLKGDEILLEARIMAVADVVESMASHRPYRPALGMDVALNEIEQNRGVYYDDAVADACLRLFREKGFKLAVI